MDSSHQSLSSSRFSPDNVSGFVLEGAPHHQLLGPVVVARGEPVAPAGQLSAHVGSLKNQRQLSVKFHRKYCISVRFFPSRSRKAERDARSCPISYTNLMWTPLLEEFEGRISLRLPRRTDRRTARVYNIRTDFYNDEKHEWPARKRRRCRNKRVACCRSTKGLS